MTASIKVRLSAMMFFEYFIWGAWYVTIGTWLSSSLHFSGQEVGLVAGTTAVGAIVAPFLVGLVADKFFATEKVLAVLHIVGSVLLMLTARQTSFAMVYVVLLLYCLCFMPTLALANSISFRQMSDPKAEFGAVRVLGTLGWIVAGMLVGKLGLEATAQPLQIAAAISLLMGLYCLTLPHTPPLAKTEGAATGGLFPKEAILLLRERSMAVFAIASFLICIPLQFYYAFTNLFMNQVGVRNAAGKMTGGQISETLCMLLIPWFFRRLGVKYMLASGMFAWVLRYILFAYGNADSRMWMLWLGIIVHGICYDFFFVTGQIYIDHKASVDLRAAAQGMIYFITYGLGMFVGAWLSGAVVQHYAIGAGFDWRSIWIFSAAASAIVLILFLPSFPREKADEDVPLGAGKSRAAEGISS
jgi:nucleoside transporter